MRTGLPGVRAFQSWRRSLWTRLGLLWTRRGKRSGHGHHLPENVEARPVAVPLHQERAVVLGPEDRPLVVELQDPRPPRRPARPAVVEAGQVLLLTAASGARLRPAGARSTKAGDIWSVLAASRLA